MGERFKRKGSFRHFLLQNAISLITLVLFTASAFFTVQVVLMRQQLRYSDPSLFQNGDIVQVFKVVDGDEVRIAVSDAADPETSSTVVRLLGIKSFDATVSDPMLSEYGKICFDYLKSCAEGKLARLEIPEKRLGDKGRLLGTLFLEDETGAYTLDLCSELIARGYTLVYTRYDFERMQTYLEIQNRAKQDHSGFWGNPRIASKAEALNMIWMEEKTGD
mgnify:FL=1